ncbi:MAG: biotin--[acetyl-CoA-carboxylase] ligase [Bacteroidaceae bacterium]|nr:biotin--[acetyl-CoA-carboxylase] ligase [Bacteroidaceae bacterium]
MHHIHLDTVDSTMQYLARPELSACEDSFIVVTADFQTAGRGQKGTSWESAKGKNLLLGLLLRPTFLHPQEQFYLSEICALALVETLNTYSDGFTIKWPNDIYFADRKVSGMLLEHTLQGATLSQTIVGIGLNINQQTFLSDAPNPVSLYQILGEEVCRETVLEAFLQRFQSYYQHLERQNFSAIHKSYLQHLYRRNEWAKFRDETGIFEGRIQDVEPTGRLVVETTEGTLRKFAFKEIAYIL